VLGVALIIMVRGYYRTAGHRRHPTRLRHRPIARRVGFRVADAARVRVRCSPCLIFYEALHDLTPVHPAARR